MMEVDNIIKNYRSFLATAIIEELNIDLNIITKFKQDFPRSKLLELNLDDFVIWKWEKSKNSFCYKLEYWDAQKLWSIRWWFSNTKYPVYFNEKKWQYIFNEDIFKSENDAIKWIWKELYRIANCESINEVEESVIINSLLRRKVFYMYNSEKIIPIFSNSSITGIYFKIFWEELNDFIEIQKKLFDIFDKIDNKNKNTYNFMIFLYKYKDNNNFVKEIEGIKNEEEIKNSLTEISADISTEMESNNNLSDEEKKINNHIKAETFEMEKIEFKANMEMKKTSFTVVISLIGLEIFLIFIIFCLVGFKILYFSDNTLNIFIWATIMQISAIFYKIINHLFPLKNNLNKY